MSPFVRHISHWNGDSAMHRWRAMACWMDCGQFVLKADFSTNCPRMEHEVIFTTGKPARGRNLFCSLALCHTCMTTTGNDRGGLRYLGSSWWQPRGMRSWRKKWANVIWSISQVVHELSGWYLQGPTDLGLVWLSSFDTDGITLPRFALEKFV